MGRSPRLTLSAACIAMVTAIAGACDSSPGPAASVTKPANMNDLLLNMRQVTASGAILNDDFYGAENLTLVFGAGSVSYRQFCAVNIVADVKGLRASIPRRSPEDRTYDVSEMRVRKYKNVEGTFGSWMILDFVSDGKARPSFDEIERFLGRNWTDCPILAPPLHGPGPLATRPRGNACIIYKLDRSEPARHLRVQFRPDATLDYVRANAGVPESERLGTELCSK